MLLLVCVPAYAANHYVREGAEGNNDGTDWTNAWTSLPVTLTRGDTYYIADGQYPQYVFNDAESDSTYIYIYKATESAHGTETGWDSGYGDGQAIFDVAATYTSTTIQFETGYWVFSGVATSDPSDSSTYGFKINNNAWVLGDAPRSYLLGCPRLGKQALQIDHITVSYVAFCNPGYELAIERGYDAGGVCAIYSNSSYDGTNFVFSHNYFWGSSSTISMGNWETGSVIEYNWFDGNWSGGGHHGQQISTDKCNYIILRNNVFRDSHIFLVGAYLNGNTNWQVYNNIVLPCELSAGWSSKQTNSDDNCMYQWEIHHNTHIGVDFGGRGAVYPATVTDPDTNYNRAYNNLFINCVNPFMEAGAPDSTSVQKGYNGYYGCTGTINAEATAITASIENQPTQVTAPASYDPSTSAEIDSLDLDQTVEGVVADSLGGISRTTDYADSTIEDDPPDIGAFEYGGSPPDSSETYNAVADSTGTGDADTDIEQIATVANAEDIVNLGAGTYATGEIAFAESVTIAGNSTTPSIFTNRKGISGFAGGGEEAGDWTIVSYFNLTGSGNSDTDHYNQRNIISPDDISADGDSIRVTVQQYGASYNLLDGISIGVSSATSGDLASTPTRLQFAGKDTITIAAADSATTDGAAFTFNSDTDSLLVHLYHSSGYSLRRVADSGGSWLQTGVGDKTMEVAISDDSPSKSSYLYGVSTIEVRTAGASPIYSYVLTGEEIEATKAWDTVGAKTIVESYGDLDSAREAFFSGDSLYVYVASGNDTTDVEIDGYRSAFDTDNATVKISNVVIDSTYRRADIGDETVEFEHVTIHADTADGSILYGYIIDSDTTQVDDATYSAFSDSAMGGTGNVHLVLTHTDYQTDDGQAWETVNSTYFGAVTYTAGTVTVTAPNGGESYTVGETASITGTATGQIDSVKIQYSTGSGYNDITTVAVAGGSFSYDWTVPNDPSTTVTVRIVATITSTISDESDAVFTITAITLTVVAPNGGETVTLDSTYTIQYTADGITNVRLAWSYDNKASWHIIALTTPATGTYSWRPQTATTEAYILLQDASDLSTFDVSDSAFTVAMPTTSGADPKAVGVVSLTVTALLGLGYSAYRRYRGTYRP